MSRRRPVCHVGIGDFAFFALDRCRIDNFKVFYGFFQKFSGLFQDFLLHVFGRQACRVAAEEGPA